MNALLAALASLPRIAAALESLATAFKEINSRAVKARASARRQDKDDEVDRRISALVDVRVPSGETSKQRTTNEPK